MRTTFDPPVFRRHTAQGRVPLVPWEARVAPNAIAPGAAADAVRGVRDAGLSRVRLRRAAAQSIPDSTDTSVAWDTSSVDTDFYDPALVANIGPVPFDGQYDVISNGRWAVNTTNLRRLWIELSSQGGGFATVQPLQDYRSAIGTYATTNLVGGALFLKRGDVIRLRVWQNSGGALNLTDADVLLTYSGPT